MEKAISEAPSNTNMLMGKFLKGGRRFWLSLTAEQGAHKVHIRGCLHSASAVRDDGAFLSWREDKGDVAGAYFRRLCSNRKQMLDVYKRRNSVLEKIEKQNEIKSPLSRVRGGRNPSRCTWHRAGEPPGWPHWKTLPHKTIPWGPRSMSAGL